jgi:hypothetical protein
MDGVLIVSPWKMPFDQLAAFGQPKIFGSGQGGV